MTCLGLHRCPPTCLHRAMVKGYHEERERQETARENDIQTEDEEYDVVTFKQWLIGNRNGGRHRPGPEERRMKARDQRAARAAR